jgi:hypothetical protein
MLAEQIATEIMKKVQERIKTKEFKDENRIGNAFTRSRKYINIL